MAQQLKSLKIKPPVEGNVDAGCYELPEWMEKMQHFLRIKELWPIVELPEGHAYTATQVQVDTAAVYILHENLSPVRRATVRKFEHANMLWHHLKKVCVVLHAYIYYIFILQVVCKVICLFLNFHELDLLNRRNRTKRLQVEQPRRFWGFYLVPFSRKRADFV